MVLTPVSVSPVESVGPVVAEPRAVIAVPRTDDDAKHGRRNKEDRARWRRRCIVVTGRGRTVRLNHFGAGIRPDSGSKTEREYHQCYHNNFVSHDRISLLSFGRLNPITSGKLPKNSCLFWNSSARPVQRAIGATEANARTPRCGVRASQGCSVVSSLRLKLRLARQIAATVD